MWTQKKVPLGPCPASRVTLILGHLEEPQDECREQAKPARWGALPTGCPCRPAGSPSWLQVLVKARRGTADTWTNSARVSQPPVPAGKSRGSREPGKPAPQLRAWDEWWRLRPPPPQGLRRGLSTPEARKVHFSQQTLKTFPFVANNCLSCSQPGKPLQGDRTHGPWERERHLF